MRVNYDWIIDLDIQDFFDTIDHELLLKAVGHYSTSHGGSMQEYYSRTDSIKTV